jgi:hypothetical protein
LPEIEDVVVRAPGYRIIRKRGDAAKLAAGLDPP